MMIIKKIAVSNQKNLAICLVLSGIALAVISGAKKSEKHEDVVSGVSEIHRDSVKPEVQKIQVEKIENQYYLKKKSNKKVVVERAEEKKWSIEQPNDEFEEYIEFVRQEDVEYYNAYNNTLKLWKIPLHEQVIKTKLGNAHIIVCGPKNAEPIVLLHGMNASSTMWYPNMTALAKNHRVYAIDNILEPGKSQLTGEVRDMNDVIKWYCEILDKLNLNNFTLIGASKGGWLATSIAIQKPWRIKNLVLLSPAQTFMWIPPGSEILSNISYTLDPNREQLNSVLRTMSASVDNIEKPFIDQYFIGTKKKMPNKFIIQMTPYPNRELEALTMPVLLLIGDQDIVNSKKSIRKARRLLPNHETGIIKNAGHFLSIDQSEAVNERILEFLSEN